MDESHGLCLFGGWMTTPVLGSRLERSAVHAVVGGSGADTV